MWYPRKMVVKNLMSHALSGYEFQQGKAVMIYGTNLCDEEQESNGAGKSVMLEGIALSILGAPLRDASAKELIREGEDSAEVEIYMENPLINQTMSIWRKFYANTKSAELELSFNDKLVEDMTSVRDGNDMIINALGIEREDLLNYYLLNKEKYVPFLRMSDTKKKQMIGRFSQADLTNPAIEKIDSDINSLKQTLSTKNIEKEKINAKIEVYEEEMDSFDLVEAKKRRKAKIDSLEDDISDLKDNYNIEVEKVKGAKEEESAAEKAVEEFNKTKKDFSEEYSKIDKKERVFNEELKELKEDHEKGLELQSRINKSLLDAVECPKCSHEFSIADEKISIAKARKKKAEADSAVRLIEIDIEDVKKDIKIKVDKKRETLKAQEKEQKRELKALEDILEEAKDFVEEEERSRDRAKTKLEEAEKSLEEIKNTPVINGTENYKKEIKKLKKELSEIGIEEVEIQIAATEELKATLVKFKTHLSNKAVGAIEAHANQYLEKTGTDISLQIDGYKMTSKGEIRENISATIFRNGAEKGSLGRFSGGEKARIEIALIMAPQKLINMNCASGGLDLLFLDEIVESIDSAGIGGIMKSLNSIGQTILVITHGTFDQAYPNMVEIVKQPDGISVIKA